MMELLSSLLSLAFLGQLLRIAVPYVFAALGGAVCERSGVVNIALEGKLLIGAFAAAVATLETGSLTLGIAAGMAAGIALAALYAWTVLRWRADQIVAGIAINLLVLGLTRYLLKLFYGSTANSPAIGGSPGPWYASGFLYLAVAAVPAVALIVSKTRFGLRLRAVGEHPEAAASLGISVKRVRWAAALAAGALAGLGGAWLALDNRAFVAEMSGGRGYIALAAVVMGSWRPLRVAGACLLFAVAEALQINLQARDIGVPRELMQMLPYLLTMIALAGFIGRSRPPAGLGRAE